MNGDPMENRTYYFRTNPLYLGVMSSIFWFVAGMAALLCAFLVPGDGIENYQEQMLLFSSFFFAWMLSGFWLVAAYYRERLVLTETSITRHGVFRTKTLFLNDITKLTWFTRFGKIVLESSQGKLKISQGNLTDFERAEIVAYLYDSVDKKLQLDWKNFIETCVPIWGKHELLTHPSLFVACAMPEIPLYTQVPEI